MVLSPVQATYKAMSCNTSALPLMKQSGAKANNTLWWSGESPKLRRFKSAMIGALTSGGCMRFIIAPLAGAVPFNGLTD